MEKFQPTGVGERIQTIDIMRGLSLLGILLVNMFAFYLPLPHIDLGHWFTEAKDIIWHQTLDVYVQSSFYPLFSMLFGYGLAMQYMKAQQTGLNFYRFAPKRMAFIFLLGVIHAFFIWWGDILAMYAFSGLFLIALLRLKSPYLVSIAVVLNSLFHLLLISAFALTGIANVEVEEMAVDLMMMDDAITAYATGTWTDAFMQRLADLSLQMNISMWIAALVTILPYMLFGAACAKWRLIERAKELKVMWIIVAIITVSAGLFIKNAPYMWERTYLLDYAKVYIGGPILAIGYAAVVVVICMLPYMGKILSPLAKVGRMSMTMYMMQSVICTLIFYNFGFGLYGQITVLMGIYITLVIFVVQILLAELWLSKFTQGPLEALMKRWTYGKKL